MKIIDIISVKMRNELNVRNQHQMNISRESTQLLTLLILELTIKGTVAYPTTPKMKMTTEAASAMSPTHLGRPVRNMAVLRSLSLKFTLTAAELATSSNVSYLLQNPNANVRLDTDSIGWAPKYLSKHIMLILLLLSVLIPSRNHKEFWAPISNCSSFHELFPIVQDIQNLKLNEFLNWWWWKTILQVS